MTIRAFHSSPSLRALCARAALSQPIIPFAPYAPTTPHGDGPYARACMRAFARTACALHTRATACMLCRMSELSEYSASLHLVSAWPLYAMGRGVL